jgi:hypothetical protein
VIFIGGPFHGMDVDNATLAAGAAELPRIYTDVESTHRWQLFPVTFEIRDPLTQVVVSTYRLPVYMSTAMGGAPPDVMMRGISDAVTRWYFATFGEPTDNLANPRDNGHADPVMGTPKVWYLATCDECTPALREPFTTTLGRAKWMQAHIDTTGHKVEWSDETDRETSDDGGKRVGDIQEG